MTGTKLKGVSKGLEERLSCAISHVRDHFFSFSFFHFT